MLFITSCTYDPLWFTSLFVLEGRQLLHHLCNQNIQWCETVDKELKSQWIKWKIELQQVENLQVPKCRQPSGLGRIIDISIHHFSDGSEYGYGQCSHIRYVNKDVLIHRSSLLGKFRASLEKVMPIPRLEVTAAVFSVKVACLLRKELQIDSLKKRFWTDSQVVLAYIRSNSKRFQVFVANCIDQIKENTRVDQWHYISGKENTANNASQGLDPRRKHQVVVGFMDHHSYGKLNHWKTSLKLLGMCCCARKNFFSLVRRVTQYRKKSQIERFIVTRTAGNGFDSKGRTPDD